MAFEDCAAKREPTLGKKTNKENLTDTTPRSKSKRHIGERFDLVFVLFRESLRIEFIWVWIVFGVAVDRPHRNLDTLAFMDLDKENNKNSFRCKVYVVFASM